MMKKKKIGLIICIVVVSLVILFITFIAGGVAADEIDKSEISNINTQLVNTQQELQTLKSNSINKNTLDTIPVKLVLNTIATQKISQNELDSLNANQVDVIQDLLQYSISYQLSNMN